ncbi:MULTISPECIES: hypothetical protein [unclassified Streptomyces]|nr:MULTISPECIES: hypothetical protein [unclassified Streptomyces]
MDGKAHLFVVYPTARTASVFSSPDTESGQANESEQRERYL